MAVEIDRLVTRFEADISDLRGDLEKIRKQGRRTTEDVGGRFRMMGQRIKAAFLKTAAVIGAAGLGKAIVSTNVEFDALEGRLRSLAKGDARLAKAAFDDIARSFSQEIPFSVDQTLGAFVRMGNLGVKPTEEALKALGNVASALGTQGTASLEQVIEAMADAMALTGFERLGELGIKMRQDGENIRITFKGMSETIAADSKTIRDWLVRLGETEFAGASESQMDTLGVALDRLKDAFRFAARDIGEAGLNQIITDIAEAIGGGLNPVVLDAIKEIKGLNKELKVTATLSSLWDKATDAIAESYAWLAIRITEGADAASKFWDDLESGELQEQKKEIDEITKKMDEESKKQRAAQAKITEGIGKTTEARKKDAIEARAAELTKQIMGETFVLGGVNRSRSEGAAGMANGGTGTKIVEKNSNMITKTLKKIEENTRTNTGATGVVMQ